MSKASVRVTSDSSNFQQEMKKAVQSMKELSSETSLATTQAKLFGSAQDALKAKISGLKAQISQQTDIVKLNKDRQQELVQQLDRWKDKQSELQSRIRSTKTAIEQSTAATGENSDETKALKAELEKLVKEEKDAGTQVEKTEDRLSKQTVATNKSEQALAELQGELKKTNKELKDAAWDEWTKKADKATAAMENVGKKFMVVTGAVVGLGAATVKTTADFDVGMSTVKAISGATGDDFDALREKAMEMGRTTAFSASEAASAMEYMAMAGWKTEDMLDGVAGVMNAAAASGEDLALTSDILTDGLTAFGMAASDSARFADVLVAAGNNANTSVAMMGETFKYAGAVCGTLGITVEDCAIATGLMGNAGIKASQAGTALRSGLSNLIKPTKEMSEAMKKYGVEVQTTEDGSVDFMATMRVLRRTLGNLDSTTQAAALSTIFGKQSMSGWAAVVTATDKDFENLTEKIYNCTGAAEEASKVRLDNLSGQITILKSTVEGIAIQIGDLLMPTIRNVVSKIQEWATAFSNLDEGKKKTILTIAGVVAAIGPLLLGGAKLIQVAKSIAVAFRNLKGIMTAVKVALGGPTLVIVAVAAAVVALVAAFKHLWETNEAFRASIIDVWTEIKNTLDRFIGGIKERLAGMGLTFESVSSAIKAVWEGLCEFLAPVLVNAFQQVSDLLTAATNAILGIVDFFVAVFRGDWEAACDEAGNIFTAAWQHIVDTVANTQNTLTGVGDVIGGWFEGTKFESIWTKTWTTISSLLEGAKEGIVTLFTGITEPFSRHFAEITQTIVAFIQGIKERLTGLGINFESISNAVVTVWKALCEFLVPVFASAFQEVSTLLKTTTNALLTTIDFFIALFRGDWQGVWDAVYNIFSITWQHIVETLKNAGNTLRGIADVILGWFGTDWNAVWTSVRDFFVGVWNAIVTAVTNVFTTIKNVVQTGILFIVELVKAAYNLITLPWQFIWQNYGDTITAAWNTIKTAVSTGINFVKDVITIVTDKIKSVVLPVIDSMQAKVTNAWNIIQTVTGTIWNSIKSTVVNVTDGLKSTVSTAFDAVKTKVSSIWDAIKTATSNTWNSIKSAITTPITNAKNTVSDMIEAIKKKFNFSWSLPKLKLPHFSISGGFSINPPSVPKFSIDWYKTGAIMDASTIFGMNGNTLLGGGEAGKEAILPLEPFYTRLGNMLDEKLARLSETAQNVVVYVTCMIDGEEITTRQIVKVEKHFAGSTRAIRKATI